MGRVGGDEFCVYMKIFPLLVCSTKMPTVDYLISETNEGFKATVTIGIALVHGKIHMKMYLKGR